MVTTLSLFIMGGKAGLYTEISPRGGQFGVWTKERGGTRRAEAQCYHVRCYTLGGGGARMTQGGANAPPPLKYGPAKNTLLSASASATIFSAGP